MNYCFLFLTVVTLAAQEVFTKQYSTKKTDGSGDLCSLSFHLGPLYVCRILWFQIPILPGNIGLHPIIYRRLLWRPLFFSPLPWDAVLFRSHP